MDLCVSTSLRVFGDVVDQQQLGGDVSNYSGQTVTSATGIPHVSRCFQHTVLYLVPALFLLMFAPLVLYAIHKSRNSPLICRSPTTLRIYICGFLILNVALQLVLLVFEGDGNMDSQSPDAAKPLARMVCMLLMCSSMVFALFLLHYCKRHGLVTSGVLFNYWLLLAVCGIPQFRLTLEGFFDRDAKHEGFFMLTLFILHYLAVLSMVVVSSFADVPSNQTTDPDKKSSPESSVSFLNQITFWWFNGMAKLGNLRPLVMDDLWELSERDKSKHLIQKFDKIRERQLDKYFKQKKSAETKVSLPMTDGMAETEFLQANYDSNPMVGEESNTPATQRDPPSIIWPLFLTFKWPVIGAALYKLTFDLLQFVAPLLLKKIIKFTEDRSQSVWTGVGIAMTMFTISIVQSMILHQYFHTMFRLGMNVRSVLSSAIYRKALLLSNGARKNRTIGEIVNLMSVDIQRFQDMTQFVMLFWSSPLQVLLALFFLWQLLGLSVIAGLFALLAFIPFNAKLSMTMRTYQQQQMALKDERLKLLNEMLNGIKVLKLYAWENSIEKRILAIRKKEMQILKKLAYLNAASGMSWSCAPFLVAVCTFTTYVIVDPANNILTPEITFVALALFNILRFPLAIFAMIGSQAIQCAVSNRRLKGFCAAEEIEPMSHGAIDPDVAISMSDVSFSWEKNQPLTLRNITVSVKKGSLVAIVGRIGSGKSSLLSAMLGEMYRQGSSSVYTNGRVAYVPQQSWIQNMTLRDNVLFGKPFDADTYELVLDVCALKQDLGSLPAGDRTEIGEKGINLSGGQKQRVSLARAAYSDCDIYLLDDPLSAVDAHVGKHLFDRLINSSTGYLKDKTRVLVTHGLSFLKHCDMIVVIKEGCISEMGRYSELLKASGEFSEVIKEYLTRERTSSDNDEDIREILDELGQVAPERHADIKRQLSRSLTTQSSKDESHAQQSVPIIQISKPEDQPESSAENRPNPPMDQKAENGGVTSSPKAEKAKEKSKLIEKEAVFTGKVKMDVYLSYLRAVGYGICVLFLCIYILSSVLGIASNLWLANWSDNAKKIQTGDTVSMETISRLGIYTALGMGQAVFVTVGSIVMAIGMVYAGRALHERMLRSILRSPMSFFDVTPLGRLMNLFGKEVDALDSRVPSSLMNFISFMIHTIAILSVPIIVTPLIAPATLVILLFYVLTMEVENLDNAIQRSLMAFIRTAISSLEIIVLICYATPQFGLAVIPLAVIYGLVLRYYVSTSRQLKRLESITRSPIYSHFQESVQGASSIRAYNCVDRFLLESQRRVDYNFVAYFPSIVANRWLAVRLELVGNLIVFFATLSAVLFRNSDHVTAGLVGLSISYALSVTQTLNWAVRMTSELETNIVSVERINEYTEKPNEAELETPDEIHLSKSWPEFGEIFFENLALRYRPDLDLVLRGVTANIKPKEKIGIIGRTGAGKSSLTLALFRLVEPSAGRILIDNVDISKLGLHDLRSRLTIVPQDPVLFSGTLRENLDPFEQSVSAEIWTALEQSYLSEFVSGLPEKLEHKVTEGGENLSVGQRQLICLARALLRKPKILVLDEAAASVDIETDHLIQQTIRTQFKDCTVLTIAHRLHSVLDSDRLLVFSEGRIAEFDSPANLFSQPDSIFRALAIDAGITSVEKKNGSDNTHHTKSE